MPTIKSNRLIKISPKLKYDMRISMKKFWSRIKISFGILFRRYDHWFFINLSREDLINLIKDEDFDVTWEQHGLQAYNVLSIIKRISAEVDDDDMILKKADFEAHAQIRKENGGFL